MKWNDLGMIPNLNGEGESQPEIVVIRKTDNRMLMLDGFSKEMLATTLFAMAGSLEEQEDDDPTETEEGKARVNQDIKLMRVLARFLLGKIDHDGVVWEK